MVDSKPSVESISRLHPLPFPFLRATVPLPSKRRTGPISCFSKQLPTPSFRACMTRSRTALLLVKTLRSFLPLPTNSILRGRHVFVATCVLQSNRCGIKHRATSALQNHTYSISEHWPLKDSPSRLSFHGDRPARAKHRLPSTRHGYDGWIC